MENRNLKVSARLSLRHYLYSKEFLFLMLTDRLASHAVPQEVRETR